jgi:hypothetical protein
MSRDGEGDATGNTRFKQVAGYLMSITGVYGLDIAYAGSYCGGEMEEIAKRYGISSV